MPPVFFLLLLLFPPPLFFFFDLFPGRAKCLPHGCVSLTATSFPFFFFFFVIRQQHAHQTNNPSFVISLVVILQSFCPIQQKQTHFHNKVVRFFRQQEQMQWQTHWNLRVQKQASKKANERVQFKLTISSWRGGLVCACSNEPIGGYGSPQE